MFSIGFYFHHFSSEHLSIKLFNIVIICTHYLPYRLFVVNAGKIVINCMQLHLCRNLVVHSSFGTRSINKNSVFVCVPCVSSKKTNIRDGCLKNHNTQKRAHPFSMAVFVCGAF